MTELPDYQQLTNTPRQFFLNVLGKQNNTVIDANSVTLFATELPSNHPSKMDSVIFITGKEDTVYYGTKEIYYNRVQTHSLINGMVFPAAAAMTMLSDLIPIINSANNVFITTEDYMDAFIEPYDAAHPLRPRLVTFTAQPHSLWLQGEVIFNVTPHRETGSTTTQLYVYSEPVEVSTNTTPMGRVINNFQCFTAEGTPVLDFAFLANVIDDASFLTFDVTLVEQVGHEGFVFTGHFHFQYRVSDSVIQTLYTTRIRVDVNGFVVGEQLQVVFGEDKSLPLYQTSNVAHKIVIAPANSETNQPAALVFYDDQGNVEYNAIFSSSRPTDTIPVLDYDRHETLPSSVLPCVIGVDRVSGYYAFYRNIETAAHQFAGVIVRCIGPHVLDMTFPAIYISNGTIDTNDLTVPYREAVDVLDMRLSKHGELFVMLKLDALDVNAHTQLLVNGVMQLDYRPEIVSEYSFLPVLAFTSEGTLLPNFKINQYGVSPALLEKHYLVNAVPAKPRDVLQQLFVQYDQGDLAGVSFLTKLADGTTYYTAPGFVRVSYQGQICVVDDYPLLKITQYGKSVELGNNRVASIVRYQPGSQGIGFGANRWGVGINTLDEQNQQQFLRPFMAPNRRQFDIFALRLTTP